MGRVTVAVVATTVVVTLVLVITAAFLLGFLLTRSNPEESPFRLHVNPADPVLLSTVTADGDTISLLGNKTADGIPTSADGFEVESAEDTTYVRLQNDSSIGSAVSSNGLQMQFIWGENFTTVNIAIVFANGTEQLSINLNLTDPSLAENFTNFEDAEFESSTAKKRSVKSEPFQEDFKKFDSRKKSRIARQSQARGYANIFIQVHSCNVPEMDARVSADVLLNYDADTGKSDSSARYIGVTTEEPGTYQVRIPTARAADVGETIGEICDKIEMILGRVCDFYSNVDDFIQRFTSHNTDSAICFAVGKGLQLAFPGLRVLPIHRFCRRAFSGFTAYCKHANADLPLADQSPAQLICDALPLVDNGIDFFNNEDVLFTPSAVYPQGNRISGQNRVLNIPPGSSNVASQFIIENDRNQLEITSFTVNPFDPDPGQDYIVSVSYRCFSADVHVQMSIVGTDSYMGTSICDTGPMCTLYVPGADALVEDVVTIVATDQSATVTRRVIVIF